MVNGPDFKHCEYTLFLFALFPRLKKCFILPGTVVLSFSINVVLTLSIDSNIDVCYNKNCVPTVLNWISFITHTKLIKFEYGML